MNIPFEKDWVDIMTALLTPTIAILGSLIAFFQWRINRLRLKHELFDKRYEVYASAMAFVGYVVQVGKVAEEERIKFLIGTKGARFLFPEEIYEYLDKIHSKACELQCLQAELEGLGGSEKGAKNIKEQCEIKKWFNLQLGEITKQVQSYMTLRH